MRLYIDADGCPVVDISLRTARAFGVETVILCDTAHEFHRPGVETIVVSKGADSVDFALVNRLEPGDVAVTQDYGLAAMCLARGAHAIHQDGMLYTTENMEDLLSARYMAQKIRRAGGRLKGPAKRKPEQDRAFAAALARLLRSLTSCAGGDMGEEERKFKAP